jgi:hypothetical protein
VTPFLVGIDLGTTNCAVAFVDTRRRGGRVALFEIPQLTEPAVVEPRRVLPSFLYFPEALEIESGAMALPWNPTPDAVAGVLARERGALVPARQVTSAKSWLAHPAVDRRALILPFGVATGPRISPVDASARYLTHIRDAWNATIAAGEDRVRLEQQRIVLTVPASFDEEARELTVEAARAAGLTHLTLIEEPIAAFYAWRAGQRDAAVLEHDRLALVCDVGGGTTDFSLIRVRVDEPAFERVAIGDHLLLGGDNVDLALATLVERRIAESRPDVRLAITQRAALRRSCSAAKERLLAEAPPDRVPVTVIGAGRAVIGDAITIELRREDVQRTIEEFLPITAAGEMVSARDRRAGLRELGLPYETDPAITRHLAAFLVRAAASLADRCALASADGRPMVRPHLVLFNGGFFTPAVTRDRVVRTLAAWFGAPPEVLTTGDLEAAVAIGAATYARLRAGVGRALSLVRAGSARAYYIGLRAPRVDEATAAVCVLARGTDEGTHTRLEHPFTVTTNRPISFALYSSTTCGDRAGDIVALRPGDDVHEHAPLVTLLRYGRKSRHVELPVRLSIGFTEVGTLELWCESRETDHRWRLQFQLRGAADALSDDTADVDAAIARAEEPAVVIADEQIAAAERAIRSLFNGTTNQLTPENVVAHLEQTMGYAKSAWPLPVIRRFADMLIEVANDRRRSPSLEARWLNLFGFCLRPGFGAAKDPWRIAEARKIYVAGLQFANAIQNRVEWLILWQRTCGGFSPGQQRELAQTVIGDLGLAGKKRGRVAPQIERESWRLLASLERLDVALRLKIGDGLLVRIRRDPDNVSLLWSIGRLGARVPLYGPLSGVVAAHDARQWIDALVGIKRMTPDAAAAIVQIGARTGDPLRDLDKSVVERARARLRDAGIDAGAYRALDEIVAPSTAETNRVFGEPLPDGLRLCEQPRT